LGKRVSLCLPGNPRTLSSLLSDGLNAERGFLRIGRNPLEPYLLNDSARFAVNLILDPTRSVKVLSISSSGGPERTKPADLPNQGSQQQRLILNCSTLSEGPLGTMNALLIRSPHIEKILAGKKIWEIRGSRTQVRGPIALIRSGSGMVVGTCEIVGCLGPLTREQFRVNARRAGIKPAEAKSGYAKTYACVLANPRQLQKPVRYKHPSGAVIWVKLDSRTVNAVLR
jgi:ASCH domain